MDSNINPQKLYGIWTEGFALDLHTLSSVYVGDDENGHPVFDTKRSEIGELLYNLKYKSEHNALDEIINFALPFLKKWLYGKNVNVIIPTPFSRQRKIQPVFLFAEKLASLLNLNYRNDLLTKESTGQSKNQDKEIIIKSTKIKETFDNVLLIDDIFETGSTVAACVKALKESYKVSKVYVLCITKRRKTFHYI